MKQITIDQKITATITGLKDRAGNDAAIDGIPVWQTDNGSVDLIASDDGMICQIVAKDVIDPVVNVTVDIDADLGDGVRTVRGAVETIAIVGGEVQVVEVGLGEPEPK